MKYSKAYAAITPPVVTLRLFVTTFIWEWFVRFARRQIISALHRGIVRGRLELYDSSLGHVTLGSQDLDVEDKIATMTVTNELFWVRVLLSYDIGFSEAYMAGDFQTPDLKAVLNLYIDNLEHLGALASPFYRILRLLDVISTFFFSHGIAKSIENVAGYNASNDMYKAFLSKEMMYSCPVWGKEEGGVRGDLDGHRRPGDLEAAQARKVTMFLNRARIGPGKRLLEIGSGWGGLAIAAARMGATVDTVTISKEQYVGAKENIANAGLEDKIRVHLLDYRHLPADFEHAFDACVSIEMLEAVGVRNMKKYLKVIDWALKDKDAFVVLSSTTYPEATYTPYQ
ncbi:hypothetical protein VNI00_009705 [Paramarasmius palmivorus]|uniref:Cyclopropane-fatty-acyl-phospholipid synthase n=1 Tax=Paramarasmius palmivorus TaxID=297713 RepID=A0AAW0CP60_9AGAR